MEKIYKITDRYSHGDFSAAPKFSPHSTLHTLYENILEMGNKIQNLMTVQHNLIRFVAHESRTPISTMLFAIEDLEDEKLSEKIQRNILSIKEDLVTLNDLVGDFLNYVKLSDKEVVLNKQVVNINQWLQTAIQKFALAPKRIFLQSNIDPDVTGTFDSLLMRHAFNNLITNAIKYAHSQVQITATCDSQGLTIQVEDDGSGILDADKEKIFTPFFQTQTAEPGGFGLGLMIAETIVKKHQGTLSVADSRLGGTCFTLVLIGI
ncbi:MAG TPA: ATP-binding protein [Gammaproteobacteria bacterium]|nr:ATP-binding protein [Gammaproteobacteria bacterium]